MLRPRHHGVADGDQRLADDLRLGGKIEGAAECVDLAGEQRRDERVDDAGGQAHLDLGELLVERGDDRRQERGDPHRTRADAEHAGKALLHGADFGERVLVFEVHQARASRQYFAVTRQRDAGRQTLEEDDADGLLELVNAPRQRRLADVEIVGGRRDVLALDDGQKMPEQPGLHNSMP